MSEDVNADKAQVEERTFQTEVQQLLQLLIHSLYTQKEIFLRELISNASDALDKIHHRALTDKNVLDPDAELDIEIEVSSSNKTLTIRDRGIGMTRDEVNENIGTIARSGSAEFARKLAETDAEDEQEKLKLKLLLLSCLHLRRCYRCYSRYRHHRHRKLLRLRQMRR